MSEAKVATPSCPSALSLPPLAPLGTQAGSLVREGVKVEREEIFLLFGFLTPRSSPTAGDAHITFSHLTDGALEV